MTNFTRCENYLAMRMSYSYQSVMVWNNSVNFCLELRNLFQTSNVLSSIRAFDNSKLFLRFYEWVMHVNEYLINSRASCLCPQSPHLATPNCFFAFVNISLKIKLKYFTNTFLSHWDFIGEKNGPADSLR